MIKKFVFFCLMLITSLGCMAQTHLYISPAVRTSIDFGNRNVFYELTGDFLLRSQITDELWSRLYYCVGERIIDHGLVPFLGISYGIGMNFNNWYGVADFRPVLKYVGNGHQIYGDEICIGLIPKISAGYEHELSKYTSLFAELGFFKELDLIYSREDLNINSFGFCLSVGVRFKTF